MGGNYWDKSVNIFLCLKVNYAAFVKLNGVHYLIGTADFQYQQNMSKNINVIFRLID